MQQIIYSLSFCRVLAHPQKRKVFCFEALKRWMKTSLFCKNFSWSTSSKFKVCTQVSQSKPSWGVRGENLHRTTRLNPKKKCEVAGSWLKESTVSSKPQPGTGPFENEFWMFFCTGLVPGRSFWFQFDKLGPCLNTVTADSDPIGLRSLHKDGVVIDQLLRGFANPRQTLLPSSNFGCHGLFLFLCRNLLQHRAKLVEKKVTCEDRKQRRLPSAENHFIHLMWFRYDMNLSSWEWANMTIFLIEYLASYRYPTIHTSQNSDSPHLQSPIVESDLQKHEEIKQSILMRVLNDPSLLLEIGDQETSVWNLVQKKFLNLNTAKKAMKFMSRVVYNTQKYHRSWYFFQNRSQQLRNMQIQPTFCEASTWIPFSWLS